MQNHITAISGAITLTITLILAVDAQSAYNFTKVVDMNTVGPAGKFFDIDYFPTISNGTVAFVGRAQSSNGTALFTGNGGAISTIAKVGDQAPDGNLGLIDTYALSNGAATFHGYYGFDDGQGIFSSAGGTSTAIAKKGDPAPSGAFVRFNESAIDGGKVVFNGDYPGGNGIFTGDGSAITTVVKTGDTAPSGTFTRFGSPSINAGETAFFGDYTNGTSDFEGVFVKSGGITTTIAKTGDPAPVGTFVDLGSPVISDGVAAFYGHYSPYTGIFTGSGGPLTTIAKYGDSAPIGTFSTFYFFPAISHGTVAFRAFYNNDADQGIFVGNGGAPTAVIKTGDPLFGSTVSFLVLYRFGLDTDGSGKLAFYYRLRSGISGIAIASPVPEPGTWKLAASSFVLVLVYNLRKSSQRNRNCRVTT